MFGDKLFEMRKKRKISQESLAALIGVSRQAIQKWENGSSYPDAVNLLALARCLHVSTDVLLGNDTRSVEEQRLGRPLIPDYDDLHIWDSYQSQLLFEYQQSLDEGKDIEGYHGLFNEVARLAPGAAKEQLSNILFDIAVNATQRKDFAYDEPSDLESIRRLSISETPDMEMPSDTVLRDKIMGAWYGRISGCLLGKPLECRFHDEIWPLLKKTSNFPMHRYLVTTDFSPSDYETFHYDAISKHLADQISCAPIDDDTNYTVMSTEIVEQHGLQFTPIHVSETWLKLMSKYAYCTAERVAYRNFIDGYRPPLSAVYKNPYREWIGAQIRADYYGYINPCDPATAADMAWRDASVSHIKNGLYGSMYVSAMLACAAGCDDVISVIKCGRGYVPKTSRLYQCITRILTEYQQGVSYEECFKRVHERYDERDEYEFCLTTSNAEIVTACLLYGGGDLTKALGMSVQCGFDTDCNGATVGSIYGMLYGSSVIDAQWTEPLNGKLRTSIYGMDTVNIDEMVDKTMTHIHWKRN